MTITPEEIARLREALEIDTEPFLLYRHNLSGMLDEIERLQDELRTVRTVYHHRCECSEDDACAFARERDEARADLREAEALLRTDSVNGDTFFAWRDRRDALLVKHKEEA